ncbi:hypothetical protein [Brevibacillus reuszeri]|uniref:hypothetical protein n=1 Tax=Brevibacillus reuszeri TaxID=54915 RepID=UPI000CCC7BDB|nr:hypothetical protein [Brevibacillus reuszeri]
MNKNVESKKIAAQNIHCPLCLHIGVPDQEIEYIVYQSNEHSNELPDGTSAISYQCTACQFEFPIPTSILLRASVKEEVEDDRLRVIMQDLAQAYTSIRSYPELDNEDYLFFTGVDLQTKLPVQIQIDLKTCMIYDRKITDESWVECWDIEPPSVQLHKEMMKQIADELKAFLLKKDLWKGTILYFNQMAYHSTDGILTYADPRNHLTYCNPETLTASFYQSRLAEVLQLGDTNADGTRSWGTRNELTELLKKYGYRYELGNQWNFALFSLHGG